MSNRMQQEFAHRDENSQLRLNKYLSEAGVCSRREADRLIESGKVTVDGRTAVTCLLYTSRDLMQARGCVYQETADIDIVTDQKGYRRIRCV